MSTRTVMRLAAIGMVLNLAGLLAVLILMLTL